MEQNTKLGVHCGFGNQTASYNLISLREMSSKKAPKKHEEEDEEVHEEEVEEEEEQEEVAPPKSTRTQQLQESKEEEDEEEEEEETQSRRSHSNTTRGTGLVLVLPYLYVGDKNATLKPNVLKAQGITHIVNCVGHLVENSYPDEFEYTTFEIDDDRNFKINKHFNDFYETVVPFRDSTTGNKVLVHCDRGESQSITLVLAYMLKSAKAKKKPLTLKAAFNYVQQKKMNIGPNDGFLRQLVNLEKELFGDSSIRVKGSGGGAGRGRATRK